MQASDTNRRDFLKQSALAAGAVATLTSTAAAEAKRQDSNGRLRVGFVGPGGRGFNAHVKQLVRLQRDGLPIELVAVCDVYNEHRDRATSYIERELGAAPEQYEDYLEMYDQANLDAVSIGTPDHWHARQTIDALKAGLHVYCEKPMTKTVEEAVDVMRTWRSTGKVMQVGAQGSSSPVWDLAREWLTAGKLGKVLMYQTEYFRNSAMGQWRYYKLDEKMTPRNINWRKWLGVDEGLVEYEDFDREKYAQWRRFWPYGSGMFTDLFVHRATAMLKATGLRFPGRVVGAGGIYLEYDGRDVPDVATVVADYPEGVQGLISSTMACEETPLRHVIRGHFGSLVLNGSGFNFVPERSQVTRNSKLKEERGTTEGVGDANYVHFKNWIDAIVADDPMMCHNDPELGAAAVTTVILGARSYREGKAFFFDHESLQVKEADDSWARRWEQRSHARGKPNHIAGWSAGDHGSLLEEPEYMRLAGPWVNGQPPEGA